MDDGRVNDAYHLADFNNSRDIAGGGGIDHRRGDFDKSLAFCLSQFVRHYATGARIRSDQSAAYVEIALGKKDRHNKVSFDLELAKLLRGAELSAAAWPRATRRPIEVDP